jgi:hypothetical protein
MPTASQEADIIESSRKGGMAKSFFAYAKMDGPGWWISGASLSAGTLMGSIGLGLRLGPDALWIQAAAMLLGLFSLFAVSHITLNCQQSLFAILKNDWNKSLAMWLAISAMITSFTWCMPQFRFGVEITVSTLIPALDNKGGKALTAFILLSITIGLSLLYEKQGPRSAVFYWILKLLVLFVVISSLASVILLISQAKVSYNELFSGLVPSYSVLSEPAPCFIPLLEKMGNMGPFWVNEIMNKQRELVLVCFSSTLGVNVLFALPLLLLNRNWRRVHVGFAKFNLFTTAFIPFAITTTCLSLLSVIAFQQEYAAGTYDEIHNNSDVQDLLNRRIASDIGLENFQALAPFQQGEKIQSLTAEEKQLATLVVGRSFNQWIHSLTQVGGDSLMYLLGCMVFVISLSTIVVLMIINGHLLCEILGKPHKGAAFQSGSLLLALASIGPFVWSGQNNWISDPTYFVSLAILPFALLSFFLLLNNSDIMGRERPRGIAGGLLNVGTLASFLFIGSSALYLVWNQSWKEYPIGKALLVIIGILLLISHFSLRNEKLSRRISGLETKIKQITTQKK